MEGREIVRLTENTVLNKTRVDNLKHVKNLNLWGNDLVDVSLLQQMPNVEVLSLSVNKINSLQDFGHCTKLQVCCPYTVIVPPPLLCPSYALVQATVGVGTALIWDLI